MIIMYYARSLPTNNHDHVHYRQHTIASLASSAFACCTFCMYDGVASIQNPLMLCCRIKIPR